MRLVGTVQLTTIIADETIMIDDNINALTKAWKAKDGGAMWANTLVLVSGLVHNSARR